MKKIKEKINSALISAKIATNNFLNNDRGDTNFISIAIILIVVIVIAIIFITLGDDLGKLLEGKVKELMDALK